MKRREFIAGLGVAATWPLAAQAQQTAMPVIGFLSGQSADDDYKDVTVAFLQGLKETGYVEGQNVAVEYRYAENQVDRLTALAADLVRRRVAVIVTSGFPAAMAATAATTTIPIVFNSGGAPVAIGLVASLNRPGANVTGITALAAELAPKQLQLLRELIPNAGLLGALADPAFPGTQFIITDLQAAARNLGLQLIVLNARTDRDLETAFATLSQQRVGGVQQCLLLQSRGTTRRARGPPCTACVFPVREHALAGGLTSYGSSLGYENHLKTAKALGLTIPETLLATADEVIQ